MDHDTEIDAINRELALLRARHAAYARKAKIGQAIAALLPTAALVLFLRLFLFDPLYGALFTVAAAIVVGAALWFALSDDLRWIDVVSQTPAALAHPDIVAPNIAPGQRARSEAELIEWQIAGCERRLNELGGLAGTGDPDSRG